jgi:ribosomal protein S18 acetylase RimI-like enzyme
MSEKSSELKIRSLEDTDLGGITALDEKLGGEYRPEIWERPEASVVAEADGKVVGFMLGEVRSGEFGLEEPTGWIEVLGVDPDYRGRAVGRRLAEEMLEHLRQRGATTVRTLVDEEMAGIAEFFEKLGFEPVPMRSFAKKL